MKSFLTWLFVALVPCIAHSQVKINKVYPAKKGQAVSFKFDYPKTVRVSNWDKNEISVEASIIVDGVNADEVFSLTKSESSAQILIENQINMAKVPKRFYAFENGVKVLFKTREELNAFLKEKGKAITANYESSDIEVVIEIKLPANTNTHVTSVYGLVEVTGFEGPIKVDATYGGIDARLSQSVVGKLTMTNRFGKIYTDFKLKPEEVKERQFFTAINTGTGKGANYDFNSSYGNIYLRNQ
jgi:hypothetical protein